MKKKLIYEAPAMDLIQVRFEQNIMSKTASTAPNMETHNDSSIWGDWQ